MECFLGCFFGCFVVLASLLAPTPPLPFSPLLPILPLPPLSPPYTFLHFLPLLLSPPCSSSSPSPSLFRPLPRSLPFSSFPSLLPTHLPSHLPSLPIHPHPCPSAHSLSLLLSRTSSPLPSLVLLLSVVEEVIVLDVVESMKRTKKSPIFFFCTLCRPVKGNNERHPEDRRVRKRLGSRVA